MKKLYTFIILHLFIYNLNNAFAQCTNPTLSINLPDTTIAFKQDSILLDAGAGYTTYSWNTGASTRFIWAKFATKYKVNVTQGNNCGTDSTQVIFIKGIQHKDTSICPNNPINLSVTASIPSNGLVGWWPFNGNANDVSGNGNNGAILGGVTLTSDRFSKSNCAYEIDGLNCPIAKGISLPCAINNSAEYSISIWFKTIDSNKTAQTILNSFPHEYIGLSFNYPFSDFSNKTCSFVGNGSWNVLGNTINWTTFNLDLWHNIVVVKSYSNLNYYQDGILKYTLPIQPNFNTGNFTSIVAGATSINGGSQCFETFKGKIDDIGVWNRALTANEITNLYSNNSGKIRWSNNDTTNAIIVSPNTSTTYYCDITVGSYTLKDSVRVNVRAFPNKSVNYAKLGLCKNDTIAFSANTGYSYNWFKNDSIVGSLQTLKVAQQGAYHVALTDSFGCKNTSDTLRVFNAPLPNVQFIINDTAHCVKENMFSFKDSTLLDSGTYNRLWNFGSSNTSTQMEPTFNFAAVGTYPIKLQVNTNYGCKDSLTKTVTVLPNPTAGPMLGATTALSVATPYVYTVAQQSNHTYNWVVTNGIIAAGQGTNAATVQWLNNGKGYLKVDVTNTQGCKDTTATQVTIGNVGLHEAGNINSLMVYPNPSNGTFAVSFNALKSSTVEMSLVNLLGQQIWNTQHTIQAGEQSIQINANLSPGVYTLRINNQNEQVQHKVMIK